MYTLLPFFVISIRGGLSKSASTILTLPPKQTTKKKKKKKKKKKSTTKIFNNLTHRVCSSTISAGVCYFIMGTWKRSVHVQESRKYMFMKARSAYAESKGIYKERKFLGQENILASVATVSM